MFEIYHIAIVTFKAPFRNNNLYLNFKFNEQNLIKATKDQDFYYKYYFEILYFVNKPILSEYCSLNSVIKNCVLF